MIRDFDRHETELRETRETMDMLDGGLRRFAAGDIRTPIDRPFPLRMEGLRRDFNRGVGALGRAIDTISDRAQTLKSQANILRGTLSAEAVAQAARHDGLRQVAAQTAAAERAARHQASHAHHVSAIAQNARADMHRPKQAIEAALKLIQQMEAGQADDANQAALKQKTEEIGRELAAIGLYVDALADHVGDLCSAADSHVSETVSLRTAVEAAAKAGQLNLGPGGTPMLALDDVDRKLADIDRETARFVAVEDIVPPVPTGEGSGRKPFLRLVKS